MSEITKEEVGISLRPCEREGVSPIRPGALVEEGQRSGARKACRGVRKPVLAAAASRSLASSYDNYS